MEVVRSVVIDHSMGVDTIALAAMVGSLALDQELAGIVVGLMFAGGSALEDVASSRARRELTALVQRAPKTAQLQRGDRIEPVPVEQVRTGDVVIVRTGDVVPVDGTVESDEAVLDTSMLTGEPLPETVHAGMPVLSAARPMRDTVRAPRHPDRGRSAYAALVRLVEQAQAVARAVCADGDRYAGFFLPLLCWWRRWHGPRAAIRPAPQCRRRDPRVR